MEQSHCGATVGNTDITDLVFDDDAVILTKSLEILEMALEALHKEAKLETRPRFRCLEAYCIKQYSLSMRVARTLRSWKTSHTMVA